MTLQAIFRSYRADDQLDCLALFDANCPEYFDPGERQGYIRFLESVPEGYELCLNGARVVGAYGLRPYAPDEFIIRWILIAPEAQGHGLGSAMMARVLEVVRARGGRLLHMAASHKSAPFFARHGARSTGTIQNGWGPDLHRVDMVLVL